MKKIISIILIFTMILSLTACGQPEQKERETTSGYYPITVTDQAGRKVVIEKEPERLISSYYITTSLMIALGAQERLVGVEDNAGLRPIYGLSSPFILELPNIGTVKEIDFEACAALEPDLAILPMKLKGSVENFEALGISVILVNPESQELLTEMIQMVGTALHTQEEAQALISFLTEQEENLEQLLSDVEKPSVYLAGNSSLLSTAGNAMYQSDLIRLGGGKNVAADLKDTYWAEIDYEQLLAWNPEHIVLASNASYTIEDVMKDPNLAACEAVQQGNVYQIPSDAEAWDSPVPSSILGAFWLGNILHPEQITEGNCMDIMDRYYEEFYGFTYSEK